MTTPLSLRHKAEQEAARLPDILARADHLASTVLMGEHGRRRVGLGDDFWQYRPAQPGDNRRHIDWRRSARSDAEYIRDREWQIAQTVLFWADTSASMRYTSGAPQRTKADQARLIGLAAAMVFQRSGERIGLCDGSVPSGRGRSQIVQLAAAFHRDLDRDYAAPDLSGLVQNCQIVLLSDCLGPMHDIEDAITRAAQQGAKGAIVQILDPAEVHFPFQGRNLFQSAGETVQFEARKASSLQSRYKHNLAQRQERLQRLCHSAGWHFQTHVTDTPVQQPLIWLHRRLDLSA